jgi:Acetyltransferase (GNAT) domain
MPNPSPITIRPYRADDEHALVGLFEAAFGSSITEDHWRWKLKQQRSPSENVWLAISGEKPVFQYAGIPTRFWLSQTATTMMVAVDTMTAPEFRRRGLLTQVAERVHAQWRQDGIAFVIGLPNQQWGSRAVALGWQPLFPLQWMIRPLRPEVLLARRLKISGLKRVTLVTTLWNRLLQGRVRRDDEVQTEPILWADAAIDQIWEHCKGDWSFSTVRDSEWVNWRFRSSPSRTYELMLARRAGVPSGYCAYRPITTDRGVIVHLAELFAPRSDSGTRDTLLWKLMKTLRTANADALFTLAVPGTPHFRWLRHAGFCPHHSFSVQLVPLSPQLPVGLMRDPNQWNLTGADFDVI